MFQNYVSLKFKMYNRVSFKVIKCKISNLECGVYRVCTFFLDCKVRNAVENKQKFSEPQNIVNFSGEYLLILVLVHVLKFRI